MRGRRNHDKRNNDTQESASSVVMAAAINESQQDCFSAADKDSSFGGANQIAEQMSQDCNANGDIGQVLNKVIPAGYRTKLSFKTPL